jgi:hypothetical protein
MQGVFVILTLLTLSLICYSSFNVASAADASGNVRGSIMCTGNPVGQNSSLALSAFIGDVPVYGNWEITSYDISGNTISVTGYLNAGDIGSESFDLQGMVTTDSICGMQVPSEVSLAGICGSSGSVRIASNNILEANFLGDIQCTT